MFPERNDCFVRYLLKFSEERSILREMSEGIKNETMHHMDISDLPTMNTVLLTDAIE